MERFIINCEISNKTIELQFDMKKMPGEVGPCYMVSLDGSFKGYIKMEISGIYSQFMNSYFTEAEMMIINNELKK